MGTADRVRFGRVAADESELRRAIETSREVARCLEDHLVVVDDDAAEMEAAG
jgi:broad specificity phosphatase PhoE